MSVLSALLPCSARRVIEAQFGQSGSFEFTKSKAREILEPLESLEEGIVKAVRNKLAEFPFSPPHNVSLDARPFKLSSAAAREPKTVGSVNSVGTNK
jgi:hypothetical protein